MTAQIQAIQREVPNTGLDSVWESLYKTGPVFDQAALHGLMKKVRDLGMPLVSVCPLEHGQADQSDVR